MFKPVFALRYAAALIGPDADDLGHPFAGALLIGRSGLSAISREAVPLARKMMRGSEDFSSSGMNLCVMICVLVTLTDHDLLQASRMVILPEDSSVSNCAPKINC